ncbi:hypothetical protein LINPERHAP1_LOCUS29698 [Linum perenne]
MRIRVRLDVRRSLKREKIIRKSNKELKVTFMYERLPTFCYICGRIGHIDRFCEVRFRISEEQIVKLWDGTLKAPPRIRRAEPKSKWLVPSPNEMVKEAEKGARQPLAELGNRKPANLRALTSNLRASLEIKDVALSYGFKAVEEEEVATEVADDRKWRRGSGDVPMGADKENRGASNYSGRHGPKNMVQAGSGAESCPPQRSC